MTSARVVARRRMVSIWGLAVGFLGCATTGGGNDALLRRASISDPPMRPGAPTLFVAMPNAADFVAVRKGLTSEVQRNFNVVTFLVAADTSEAAFGAALERANPVCVVLMNNATMNLFQRYQHSHAAAAPLPTVVVMASFLEEVGTKMKRATGIAYEVPGVTAFVNLRSVIEAPVGRVGVVYRHVFQKFVERQMVLAAREQIELVPVPVASEVSAPELRETLHHLIKTSKIDAVWMLNDNALLRDGAFLNDAWRLELAEAKVPVVVGVPNLVDPQSPFGTLAVVPDHEALGLQTANLIFDLSENGWDVAAHPVELPLSVKTIVDVRSVRANFGLRDDALRHIDKALE